jgi:hypothetical protein
MVNWNPFAIPMHFHGAQLQQQPKRITFLPGYDLARIP